MATSTPLSEPEEAVVKRLERSVAQKATELRQLRDTLMLNVEEKIHPQKHEILQSVMDHSSCYGKMLVEDLSRVDLELRQLQSASGYFRDEVRFCETLKTRLDLSLKFLSTLLDLRQCHAELREAIEADDLEKSTQLLVWFRQLAAVPHISAPDDVAIIASTKLLEQQFVDMIGSKFRQSILQGHRDAASRLAALYSQLSAHEEGVLYYINYLRESISNECASNYRALIDITDIQKLALNPRSHGRALSEAFRIVANLIKEHRQQCVAFKFDYKSYMKLLRELENEVDIQATRIYDHMQSICEFLLIPKTDVPAADFHKDYDVALDAISFMSYQSHRFLRLIHAAGREAQSHIQFPDQASSAVDAPQQKASDLASDHAAAVDFSPVHGLSAFSALARRNQELMTSAVSLEHTYASRSLKKASETAEIDLALEPFASTLIEDVFFILKKSLTRTLDSLSNFAISSLLNLLTVTVATTVLSPLEEAGRSSSDFYLQWLAQNLSSQTPFDFLEEVPNLPGFHSALAQLVIPSRPADPAARTAPPSAQVVCPARFSWPHTINDLRLFVTNFDVLHNYVAHEFTLRRQLLKNMEKLFTSNAPSDATEAEVYMFEQSLTGFQTLGKEAEAALDRSIDAFLRAFFQALFPELYSQFEALSLVLDQTTYADYQVNDPWISFHVRNLAVVAGHLQTVLLQEVFETVMVRISEDMAARLQSLVLAKPLNFLGSLQLENDIKHLSSTMTRVTSGLVRSKFTTLNEIVEIVSAATIEDLKQLINPLALDRHWKLTRTEMRQLLQNRVEFHPDQLDFLNDLTLPVHF